MFEERPRSDELVERKQVKVIVKSTVCNTTESGFIKIFLYFGILDVTHQKFVIVR